MKFRDNFCSIVVICFIISTISCSVKYVANDERAIRRDDLKDTKTGIVIGRVTLQQFYGLHSKGPRGIGFRDCIDNNETVYINGHYFFIRLPEGCYSFDGIGTPAGGFQPYEKPFYFYVTRDKVKYIGSFVSDEDLYGYIKENSNKFYSIADAIVSEKRYYVRRDHPINFYVIDETERVVSEFRKRFPVFSNEEVLIEFMK